MEDQRTVDAMNRNYHAIAGWTSIQKQRRTLDWHESIFGDSEFTKEWKRYVLEQQELLES